MHDTHRYQNLTRRAALALSAGVLGASVLPRAARAAEPLAIVATTGMIADAARVLGGEAVSVKGLMGPGVDPHSYRQTRSDIVALSRADLVLRHGLYLEAQMEDFMEKLGTRKPVRAVAEVLPREVLVAHDTYADKFDPHVWMSPALWQPVVAGIAAELSVQRPDKAEAFGERLAAYAARVADLEAYGQEVLASVPEEARVLVTAHDAFKYFGRDFGFEVVGIQGISTESEAGLNRIAEIVDLLVDRRIGAVFVESSVSDRNMRALVEGASARGHEVRIGGELFSDAMGAPGTYEGTYLGMIDHNFTTIAAALGGHVPPRGMLGALSGGA